MPHRSAIVPAAPAAIRHSLGLVLSGGGSRGIAHIGVLRALLEHGLPPDCLAGVSAGAIVGALYAAGHSTAAMLEFFQSTNPYRITHVTFAKPGILDPQKLVPAFRRYFPENSFESLGKPLRLLATDLFSGEAAVFDSGPLIAPVLASSAVPMVFSPMEINGRWYVDGGIVDNFPVGLLRDRCRVLLGVHVSPIREIAHTELGTSLAVIERALEVGMYTKSAEHFARCDLLIRPPDLVQYGMFDTRHFVEIEAAGYAAALGRIPEIRYLLNG